MNKLMAAVACAIVLPGVAHAEAAPAEEPSKECCEKMMDKPANGSASPASDPYAGHDMVPGAARADGRAPH